MIDQTQIQYFLASNTPQGFHSLFHQLLPSKEAQAIYLLQGGVGETTSSLLRQIDNESQARGQNTQQILCTANPNQLDALLIPSLKIALVDASAPHNLEPNYIGLIEHYVDLSPCYLTEKLEHLKSDIFSASQAYKEAQNRTTPCLTAAEELRETILHLVSTEKLQEKLTKRAKGILNREFKTKKPQETGSVTQRFLSAITPEGRLFLDHTASLQCQKIFLLWDNYHIAHQLLLPLLSGAVQRGYHVIACLHPQSPKHLEHLLIPELSLAFLTNASTLPFSGDSDRKIRLETMIDTGLLKHHRNRLRTYRKMYHALLDEIILIQQDNQVLQKEISTLYDTAFQKNILSQITADLGKKIFQDL